MEKFMVYFQQIALANFVGIVLLFLLPFVSVSCGGMAAGELSGKDLALGAKIEQAQSMSHRKQDTTIKSETAAGVALAAAMTGVVGSVLFKGAKHARLVLGLGVLGTGALLWLQHSLNTQAVSRGQGMLLLDWQSAYWLAVELFASVGALAMIWLRNNQTEDRQE
jgi:hypothetical protein